MKITAYNPHVRRLLPAQRLRPQTKTTGFRIEPSLLSNQFNEAHLIARKGDLLGLTFLVGPQENVDYPYDPTAPNCSAVFEDIAVGHTVRPTSILPGPVPLLEVHFTTALGVSILVNLGRKSTAPVTPIQSTVQIAIRGKSDFDATKVDPKSVHVGPLYAFNSHVEDVNNDGLPDLVCDFDRSKLMDVVAGSSGTGRQVLRVVLEGETVYGERIYGQQTVYV
jgi:hypothetical protein